MDRKEMILRTAQRDGRVQVDDLATALNVSAHTIRRDLNALCAEARLRRIHGGAEFIDGQANMPYGLRAVLNLEAKQRIAAVVADFVEDGSTVFISIGTTPAIVAEALTPKDSLTVITNNLNAALALAQNESHRIILPGGELRLPDCDFINESVVQMFAGYRADYGIYGVGGIDLDGSLLDFHEPEVRAREHIRCNSRRSILVADSSKFGRRAAAVGGNLDEVDCVVIDQRPDARFDQTLARIADRMIVAQPEGAKP